MGVDDLLPYRGDDLLPNRGKRNYRRQLAVIAQLAAIGQLIIALLAILLHL